MIVRKNRSYHMNLTHVSYHTGVSNHIRSQSFKNLTVLQRRSEMWIPVNLTHHWEESDGLSHFTGILQEELDSPRKRVKCFLEWFIFAIVSAISNSSLN